jgi:hypothetical protein
MAKARRMQSQLLQEMADFVREIYIINRRLVEERMNPKGNGSQYTPGAFWDGGFHSKTNTYRKAIWPTVRDFIIEHQVSTEEYIRFVADTCRGRFSPTALVSEKQVAAFKATSVQDLREAFIAERRAQENVFESAVFEAQTDCEIVGEDVPAEQEVQTTVLSDKQLAMSALFRYCVAWRLRRPDLMQLFRGAAAVQYLQYTATYDETWNDLLPLDFKDSAKIVAESLHN